MNSKYQEALPLMRSEVLKAAQAKLARPLSEVEVSAVEYVHSLMRLESLWLAFSSPIYFAEQVEKDLHSLSEAYRHDGLA